MSWMRRLAAISLAALALTALLQPAIPASAKKAARAQTGGAPADYTATKGLSQPRFKTIRESFMVPMKDGINMYVEVERPDAKGRFGTILELSPYHGPAADRKGTRILPGPVVDGEHIGLSGYFAPRGYAVVFADLRGTGRSEGCLDHMGPNDQSDAYEVVEWAAKQPWSNGRVGMTGHSYVGSTPQMAAAQNPPHLVTIVPSAGLAAMYHHEFQNGVPYYLQWMGPAWAYESIAIARHLPPLPEPVVGLNSRISPTGGTGDNFGNGMEYFGCGATQSAFTTGEAFFSGAETEWHRERDFRAGATKSKIPVFMVHGVNDNAARIAAIDWYNAREGRPGDKTWIGQWDHGTGARPNTRTCLQEATNECKDDEWTTALHAWFDKHLLQRKVDTGPAVEIFLNNSQVFTAKEWPVPANEVRLFPQSDGSLTQSSGEEGSVSYIADPRAGGPTGEGFEHDTGSVAFQTEPLKEDVLITGVPKMRLSMSSTSPRIHVTATLYDVSSAAIDRIGRAGWAIQPELREGWDEPQTVVPGERMTMDLVAMSQAHLLKAGHSLMLRIASSHPDKVPVFGEGAQVTIYTGGKDGTSFTIPVVVKPTLYSDPMIAPQ